MMGQNVKKVNIEARKGGGRKVIKMKKGNWCAMKTKNEDNLEKLKNGGRKRKKKYRLSCICTAI
jgi:hypothetical protein